MSIKSLRTKVKRRTGQRKPISKLWKPIQDVPIRIRLIPGEYTHPDGAVEPIGFYVSHYYPTKKQFINCSSKWLPSASDDFGWDRSGKCLACHAKETGQIPNLSTSRKYPATVIVCNKFHLNPNSYNDEPLPIDKDGNQIYRKEMCLNDSEKCPWCKKGYDTEWGRKMIWEIPETHLAQLIALQDSLSSCCANCGLEPDPDTGEGGIYPTSVNCKSCMYDFGVDALQYVQNEQTIKCPKCGEIDIPGVLYDCPECHNAKPPSLFDIDFTIQRDSTGKGILVTKALVKKPDRRITNNPRMLEALDLDKFYKPTNIEAQAAKLDIPNPWADAPAPFKDYSA